MKKFYYRQLLISFIGTLLISYNSNLNAQYTLIDNDVVVTNGYIDACTYSFAVKDIIIPDSLDGQEIIGITNKTYPNGTFENKLINSVKLPATIKEIGDFAFYGNNLSAVVLPDSLERIGGRSFSMNKISTITITDKVTKIAFQAFLGNKLTTVYIPNNVVTIEYNAFYNNLITSVTIESNPNLAYIGGGAFSSNPFSSFDIPEITKSGFVDWADQNGNSFGKAAHINNFDNAYTAMYEYTLTDDDVVVVDGEIISCSYNFTMKNIIIPDTLDGQAVKKTGDNVFYNKGIRSVSFPVTLENIGDNSFNFNVITKLTIPKNIKTIGYTAFYHNKINTLIIPDTCQLSFVDIGAFTYLNTISYFILPCTEIPGYTFHGWIDNKLLTYNAGDTAKDLNLRYTSVLTANINLFSFDANGGSGIMEDLNIATDSVFHLPENIFIRPEYKFLGWADSANGSAKYADASEYKMGPESHKTLYAVWTNLYDVRFISDSGGEISGNVSQKVLYNYNASTVIALPDTGYRFVKWETLHNDSISNIPDLTVEHVITDTTLRAIFALKQYSVVFNNSEGGTLTGVINQTVEHGNNASQVAAVPSPGYHFKEWETVSGDSLTNSLSLITTNIISDTIINAVFEPNTNTLHFYSNGGSGSMFDMYINTNETVNLLPNMFIREGYTFTGWSATADGNVEYADEDSYIMGNESNYSLYSIWSINTYIQNSITDEFKVFPNPANGIIYCYTEVPAIIEIYNLSGKILEKFDKNEFTIAIDLTKYAEKTLIFRYIDKQGNSETITIINK